MALDYPRLNFADFEIRLLNLDCLNAEANSESIQSLDTWNAFSLVAPPQYYAVSYCWGDPSITTTVVMNHQKVQATVNLEAALRQLRGRSILKVWVDAICINQRDYYEKGNHIQLMGQVYAGAVRVYHGPERGDCALVINDVAFIWDLYGCLTLYQGNKFRR